MSAGRRILLVTLGLLAVALLTLGWLSRHSFSREPTELEVGLQGEALENDTLLLQKWLEAGGRPVTRRGGEIDVGSLPKQGTLIVLNVSLPPSAAKVQELLAWVRGGGYLFTDGSAAPFNDGRTLAHLHEALGVRLADCRTPGPARSRENYAPGLFTFQEGETPYRIGRSNVWRLYPDRPKDWAFTLGHKGAYDVLSRPEGSGRITLTADLNFLHSQRLTKNDHAAYLERLLALGPDKGPVVVWSKPVELSLFSWLWTHAWAPGLGLLTLLAAWVWRGWSRLGPLLPEPLAARRSLREHLNTAARFVWFNGSGAHLVLRAQQALEKRAARLNPAYPALDPGARADWLAQATGGNTDAILDALDDRPGRPSSQLAQDLLTLERLRQHLRTPSSQDTP